MSQPAIIVDGISKRYRLGHANAKHQTFREMATDVLVAPFRKLRAAGEGGNEGEEFWALKDVSFEVQPGEVVGIIGRNGAGKSTLLKVLSRITEPTSGQIRLRGRVASLLEVGTGFHPELTGRENIYLNGAILGMKRTEIATKFDEIVAFAETEKFLDTPVKFYSSGMYVRLAFAVAAHLEPEILIVDEVLAVGDIEFQKKCLGKIKEVSEQSGRTVLFVSHNMGAIESLCTRGVVLSKGQVSFIGSATQAVARYLDSSGKATQTVENISGGPFHLLEGSIFGLDSAPLRTLDAAVVKLRLVANEEVRRFGLHLIIETESGMRLGDLDTFPANSTAFLNAGETYEITVLLNQLPLHVGDYRLQLQLRDDFRYRGLDIDPPLSFHVNDSITIENNSRHGNRFGSLALKYELQTKSMSNPLNSCIAL
ncbi:MAG TPA: ABC transporter ATP-binding protein [Tepidisphaeraceae bacterium]|jgi:lipopolysaccharide transport system ATP-binding protein